MKIHFRRLRYLKGIFTKLFHFAHDDFFPKIVKMLDEILVKLFERFFTADRFNCVNGFLFLKYKD